MNRVSSNLTRGLVSAVAVLAVAIGVVVSAPVAASAAGGVHFDLASLTQTPSPTIVGTPAVGSVLSASTGTWGPGSVTFAFKWFAADVAIAGATASTYTPVVGDVGKKITLTVTGSESGYTSVSRSSGATTSVVAGTFTATPSPTITGTAAVGSTLAAITGTWAPGPVTFTYIWYSAGVIISGQTAPTYTVAMADVGKKITLTITGSRPGFTSVAKSSGATPTVPNPVQPTPAVQSLDGETLIQGGPGLEKEVPASTYSCNPTGTSTMVLTSKGTATGPYPGTYSETVTVVFGPPTGAGENPDFGAISSYRTTFAITSSKGSITGTKTLQSNPEKAVGYCNEFDGQIVADLDYTAQITTPAGTATDTGQSIWTQFDVCEPSFCATTEPSDGPGNAFTDWFTSLTLTPGSGASLPLTSTPLPTIVGTASVGASITVRPGTWQPAPVTLSYQWNRNGTPVSGATGVSYNVTAADAGYQLSVTVTGSKTGYTSKSVVSAPTARVPSATITSVVPTITGTAKFGQTLTASAGTWGPGVVSLAYRWARNGVTISGATAKTYRLVAADVGTTVTVTVTGVKPKFISVSQTSAATRVVEPR